MEIVLLADALEGLRTLEPENVHTCVTSPPYYNPVSYTQLTLPTKWSV